MSKKSKHQSNKERFTLTRLAMNPSVAYAYQLAIKLEYVPPEKDKPQLQMFVYDDEAKLGEWEIYGADPEVYYNTNRVARIEFSALNETKEFTLDGATYRVAFERLGEIEVDYPRGGKTMEPVYEFSIELL